MSVPCSRTLPYSIALLRFVSRPLALVYCPFLYSCRHRVATLYMGITHRLACNRDGNVVFEAARFQQLLKGFVRGVQG